MGAGFVLNITQETINRLKDADEKITQLAKTSEDAQTKIVSAFKSINTHGIDAFINKLTEAQTKLSQLGNTQVNIGVNSTAIDEINRIITAVGRARTATGEMGAGLSPQSSGLDVFKNGLDSIFQKIERLKNEMDQFRQWEGGNLLGTADYAHIGRVTDEINRLMQAYIELDKARQTIQQKDPFKAKIDDLSRDSLEAQRYKDSMQAMKEFYAEQDKERKKAAKEDEADRKKREKEEKATAERIAAYDSKARRERYKAYTSTYEGAMRTSDRAKTLLQEQQAIKNLEAARAKLNKTDSDYANKLRNLNQRILEHKNNIDKATAGSKNLQKQHRNLMDISGQLARRLALVFSVSQITGYVKKLIEVRGEFELQQRSLQAILQNKDEANRIWQQTVDLAVRSPFRVKELVSYTKQLAAYRIESDKLFETNKMLADISAGLGVDMQRLILAFGQVRSAAYLRGTELRQFTEAGIPILEQLAQYFTELEGRAVSVGDVFERVSKRMVSFADVEEIFRRMTSEGGTFYRMQEIQAETLKGMWSNLKDSVDIMVNEIGKGNESTLKNSLALVKQLVDNWRKVKPVIETAGISLMTYFGVDVLRKIGRALVSMFPTLSAHPVLAVASAFALLATYIWRAAKAQTEFNAAMSEVENENIKSLEDNIRLYHELRDAINDVTKSSEDREKAYNRLKSVFDDILPQEYLAKEYVEDLSKGYKDAEKAMTDYYDAKTQAQKKDRIEGLYAKELDTDISELITSVRNRIETRKDIPEAIKPILQSGVSGIVNEIIEEVKSGDLANDIDTIADEIQKRLEKYGAVELPWTQAGEGIFHVHDVKDIVKTLGEYKDALEDIQGLPFETYGQKVASEWLNKEKESLREISDIYKKLLSLYSKYSKATDEDKVKIAEDISLAMSQVPEKLNAYLPLLQESVDKMKGIAEKGAFEFTASMQTLESDFIEGLAGIAQYAEGEIGDVNGNKIAQTLSSNLQEGIKEASDKLDMTPFQNAVVGGARQIAEKFGQDVNIFEKFIPNQKESLSNIRQEVKSQIESYETQIKEMQTSLTQGAYVLSEEVLNNTQETIQSMTDQLPALKAFLAFLGEVEKKKEKEEKASVKILQRRINLLKEVNKKYLELTKTFDSQTAEQKIIDAYSDTFKEAFEGTGVDLDLYKVMTQSVIDAKKIGGEAGSALTEGMLEKLKELESAGTYIRSFSDDLVEEIKKAEGFRAKAYQDAGGVWTQGYGETQGIEKDKAWTEEFAAQRLQTRLTEDYAAAVNKVLDANRDLIITQEQYNALVDLAYQGGGRAVKYLVNYAKDVEQGASYIERISKKIEATMGEEAAARFGETFVNSFKEAETIQERMALLLQTMNLTIKGKINKDWYEGMQARSDKRAAMFSGDLDVAKQLETVLVRIAGMDFKTTEGMVKALSQLKSIAEKGGPEAQKILSQAISGLEAEIGLRIKKEENEKLKNEVQELFDRYDLSLELKKLNIPPDLAKSLFDVDYLDLDGLKKAVQEQEAKFIGTDMEKEYKKFLDKIDDMEDKAAKERMKTYVKYLMEGMSERVKLKIEEMRKLKEIEESDEFTPEQKERIMAGVSKEARAEQQKQEWKDFQGSDMYTMMFEDLEHYGSAAIDALYKKLSELKTSLSDLPASEVKEIVGQIEKLENIKIERNPFESLKTYKNEVKNIGFSEDELQNMLMGEVNIEKQAQDIIDVINIVQQSIADGGEEAKILQELTPEQLRSWEQAKNIQQQTGETLDGVVKRQERIIKKSKEHQTTIVGQQKAYKELDKSQEAALKETEVWLSSVGDIFSASKELMESLGVESDSVAMTIADTGSSMVSLILSAVQFTLQLQAMGVAANSALGIIGWIAIAIQAVATILSAIFSAKDKALQKEIDGHLARAEKLHEKYEELSDAIDSAYDASVVRGFNKEIEETLRLEIAAIEAAIAAEKSQKAKKVDWDWVAEQEAAVKDLYDTLNEEHDKYIARWGGFGSDDARLDFIESMTQAWLDSFKETGDGLAGLEEKWDEYFDNLVMKQMALRVSKAAIDKYLDMWDKYVSAESAGGEDLTEAEAQDLRLKKEQLLKELSERYTNLAESLGITPTTEGGGLSALSKSIQGVSESTAQVLESLLNSMRFYVADSNAKLTQLLNNMMSGETESPMLAELRAQTKWMRDIYNLINGMTATHPSGGRGIKTVM